MLANMARLNENVTITLDCGVGNHRRCIDVSKLYGVLGENLSIALAGFHALTGILINILLYSKFYINTISVINCIY